MVLVGSKDNRASERGQDGRRSERDVGRHRSERDGGRWRSDDRRLDKNNDEYHNGQEVYALHLSVLASSDILSKSARAINFFTILRNLLRIVGYHSRLPSGIVPPDVLDFTLILKTSMLSMPYTLLTITPFFLLSGFVVVIQGVVFFQLMEAQTLFEVLLPKVSLLSGWTL